MKRILAIATVMVIVAAASVSAETVNLGIVTMEKTDIERIQGLMDGSLNLASETPAAKTPAAVNIGLLTIDANDLAALQDLVSGKAELADSTNSAPRENLVNIGLVEMEASDLQAINLQVKEHFKNGSPLLQKLHIALK